MRYHLAIDIGASSGRMVLGWVDNFFANREKVKTEEIYRFDNGMVVRDGQLCWDLHSILLEIATGFEKCKTMGKIPVSVGIDTWGVDFVLLDEKREMLGNSVAYRDKRTEGMREAVHAIVSEGELYERTGILSHTYNTVYQLMAIKKQQPMLLKKAAYFLMIPDYLHYRLCGAITNEYTNATTTGLVNAFTRDWDRDIIGRLAFPQHLFKAITPPGTVIGPLLAPGCAVIATATHDTANAVMMALDDAVFISSGTWSMVGIKRKEPDTSLASCDAGFTNEGGYGGDYIYCKNIMGLWMIQCVRKELDNAYDYPELNEMAKEAEITSIVDCNDERFFAPESMINEIKTACAQSGQPVPDTPAELAKVVYQSLAVCYAKSIKEIENLTGRTYDTVNIIGGGAKAEYLNRLTETHTGKKIITGPYEATAIGNLAVQIKTLEKNI
jgi:rhamnulokinase